jgi:hypothetical protein
MLKNKFAAIFFLLVLSTAMVIIVTGCNLDSTGQNTRTESAEVANSIEAAPYLATFVGYGCNLLEDGKPYMGTALDKSSIVLDTRNRGTAIDCFMIEDKTDLEKSKKMSIAGSVDTGSVFSGVSVGASFSYEMNDETKYSGNSVFVVVRFTYIYGEAILERANFMPGMIDLYKDNKTQFYNMFGNGYVKRSIIGNSLYYLYSFSLKTNSTMSYEQLKAKLSVEIASFKVSGEFSKTTMDSISNSNVTMSSKLLSNGSFIYNQANPSTRAEINALMNAYASYLIGIYNAAYVSKDFSNTGELGQVYRSYEDLIKELDTLSTYACDVDQFFAKMMEWWKIKVKITKIKNDLESGTFSVPYQIKSETLYQIQSALSVLEAEITKCKNRDAGASYPAQNLYSELINFERTPLASPIVDGVVSPNNVTLYWNSRDCFRNYDVYINNPALNLNNVKAVNNTTRSSCTLNYRTAGMYEWIVSAEDAQGMHFDSVPSEYIIPGFKLADCPANNSIIPAGTRTFLMSNPYGKLTNTLYLDGVAAYTGGSVAITVNLSPAKGHTLYVNGSSNGTSANSDPLTIYTKGDAVFLNCSGISYMALNGTKEISTPYNAAYTYTWENSPGISYFYGGDGSPKIFRAARLNALGIQWVSLKKKNRTTNEEQTDIAYIIVC